MKKYVLTGGPSVGKTTVLTLLKEKGYLVLPESARPILEQEQAKEDGILPTNNPEKFQEMVAIRQAEKEKDLEGDIAFLDRSLIDGYAYCILSNVSKPKLIEQYAYNAYEKIFILDRLPFIDDGTRWEDSEKAQKIHKIIEDTYKNFNYELITVPVLPPEERVQFILERL